MFQGHKIGKIWHFMTSSNLTIHIALKMLKWFVNGFDDLSHVACWLSLAIPGARECSPPVGCGNPGYPGPVGWGVNILFHAWMNGFISCHTKQSLFCRSWPLLSNCAIQGYWENWISMLKVSIKARLVLPYSWSIPPDWPAGCGCSHQPDHPRQTSHASSGGVTWTQALATCNPALKPQQTEPRFGPYFGLNKSFESVFVYSLAKYDIHQWESVYPDTVSHTILSDL